MVNNMNLGVIIKNKQSYLKLFMIVIYVFAASCLVNYILFMVHGVYCLVYSLFGTLCFGEFGVWYIVLFTYKKLRALV